MFGNGLTIVSWIDQDAAEVSSWLQKTAQSSMECGPGSSDRTDAVRETVVLLLLLYFTEDSLVKKKLIK